VRTQLLPDHDSSSEDQIGKFEGGLKASFSEAAQGNKMHKLFQELGVPYPQDQILKPEPVWSVKDHRKLNVAWGYNILQYKNLEDEFDLELKFYVTRNGSEVLLVSPFDTSIEDP